ncbi:MurR/RpiR family transcriptional regulator [Aerococcus agrisoli]|nr:MurR/RpiR family transcriptional regulator [Aerococcus agrisoli]
MQSNFLKQTIQSKKSLFSNSENVLAEYLLTLDQTEIINKTISELSIESGVSQTTIFNFVLKLGFSGFQNFKITLASKIDSEENSSGLTSFGDINKNDTVTEVAQKIISLNQNSLEELLKSLNSETIEKSVQLIEGCKSLHFFGQGGSSVVAFDGYHKFIRSKFRCNYISDYHIQLSYATKLGPDDCVILFSHTGDTHETINIAKVLKENKCPIISLTGNPSSELVDLSNQSFIIYSDESKFRTESLTSRILYLTVLDILYTIIMFKNEDESIKSLEEIRSALKITRQ